MIRFRELNELVSVGAKVLLRVESKDKTVEGWHTDTTWEENHDIDGVPIEDGFYLRAEVGEEYEQAEYSRETFLWLENLDGSPLTENPPVYVEVFEEDGLVFGLVSKVITTDVCTIIVAEAQD